MIVADGMGGHAGGELASRMAISGLVKLVLAMPDWIFRLDETPMPPEEITAQATTAVELDPADARARMVAASAYFFTKQVDSFAREADQALALAPYDAEIMAVLACMISAKGDHERGVALAEKANGLNPDAATGWYH